MFAKKGKLSKLRKKRKECQPGKAGIHGKKEKYISYVHVPRLHRTGQDTFRR